MEADIYRAIDITFAPPLGTGRAHYLSDGLSYHFNCTTFGESLHDRSKITLSTSKWRPFTDTTLDQLEKRWLEPLRQGLPDTTITATPRRR